MIPLKIKLKILDIKGNLYTKRPDVYFYTRKLVALKKCCPGQRCFIVGNGPSLTIEDLEKIKNEFCFAANRIYTLYDKILNCK